jgi:transposase
VGLSELSVMEQRFHAVMECLGGMPKTEVAARYGVSRQSVHTWVARYAAGGVKGSEGGFQWSSQHGDPDGCGS